MCRGGNLITETFVLFNATVGLQEVQDVVVRLLDLIESGCVYLEDVCVGFSSHPRVSNPQDGSMVNGWYIVTLLYPEPQYMVLDIYLHKLPVADTK